MNEAILIWLYLSLEDVLIFTLIIGWVGTLINLGVFPIIWDTIYDEEEVKKALSMAKRWLKFLVPFTLVITLLAMFYPTKEDLKWIIGGALVWNGVEYVGGIEGVERLPKNTVDAMNRFLESVNQTPVEED